MIEGMCLMSEENPPIEADHEFDASGKYCADLTPAIKAAMRDLASGETIAVHCDDATARTDVPAWSRLTGHRLLQTIEQDDTRTTFILERK
jgi:tRNA 2-thiouridine synthesizing protein A